VKCPVLVMILLHDVFYSTSYDSHDIDVGSVVAVMLSDEHESEEKIWVVVSS